MRRATVRTESPHAETVVAALEPDNTAEMETRVHDQTIKTTITRETTGGLRTTLDDYVVNLSVAERVTRTVTERTAPTNDPADDTDNS